MIKKIIIRFLFLTLLFSRALSGWAQPKMLWENSFGSSFLYNFGVSQITSDDGLVYLGSYMNLYANYKPSVCKYDSAGNFVWSTTLGNNYECEMNCIKETTDGGFILAGRIFSSETSAGLWILKLNANGDSVWSRNYSSDLSAKGNDIIANPDGTFFIVGQIEATDHFRNFMWVLKLNNQGDTLWSKKYDNSLSYWCESLIKCPDGGYAVIATIDSTYEAALYSQIIRFDENGDTLWTKSPETYCRYNSISATSDNGFVITGMKPNIGLNWDLLLLKTNSKGEEEWSSTFGGTSWEMGYEAKQTINGGYIIAGTNSSFGSGDNLDGWLIKTDHHGNKIWDETFGGEESNERLLKVFVTSDNGYYITGNVKHLFWLARLETDTIKGVSTDINGSISSKYTLVKNYPNPFSSTTCIEYSLPNPSKVTISVFNLQGKEVVQLTDQLQITGQHRSTWNGENWQGKRMPDGIYYYQILVEDNTTGKTTRTSNKVVYRK